MGLSTAEYRSRTMHRGTNFSWALSAMWMIGMLVASANGQTVSMAGYLNVPDTLGTHDPSRLIEDNGSFYFYGTSQDVSGSYTADNGTTWKSTGSVLKAGVPANVLAVTPLNNGHETWAPDVIYNPNTKLFYVYYAVPSSTSGSQLPNSIGLVTSPTLNPATAVWTNAGPVIWKTNATAYNCIDPAPFFDTEGNMWLAFGSQYGGNRAYAINIVALDKTTGLRASPDNEVYQVQDCTCEASYVQPHDGYYYLFWNTGGCCNGASSSYTIHMARSTVPSGPYSDAQVFLASTSTEHGPGQIGFITIEGKDYFTYHYYPNSGFSVLGIAPVTWTSTGWPSAPA